MENSFSGKTVLVTGATGLIGSHLVDALMKRMAGVILDNTKLKALGWRVQVSIQEGIERTLDFHIRG